MDIGKPADRVFDRADTLPSEGKNSDLNRWLFENARDFAERLSKLRRVSWPKLARALFIEEHIHKPGDESEPVLAETLRSAWYRTRVLLEERGGADWVGFSAAPRAKRGQPARAPKPPRQVWPAAPGEIAPGVRPAPVEAPTPVPAPTEPAGMPDDLIAQLSVGQRHLKRGA